MAKRRKNTSIVGVALSAAGKFLGFVDGMGKIKKGRVRRVKNPAPVRIARATTKTYAIKMAEYYRCNGYRAIVVKADRGYEVRVYDTVRTK
jgi:hypothetical protein